MENRTKTDSDDHGTGSLSPAPPTHVTPCPPPRGHTLRPPLHLLRPSAQSSSSSNTALEALLPLPWSASWTTQSQSHPIHRSRPHRAGAPPAAWVMRYDNSPPKGGGVVPVRGTVPGNLTTHPCLCLPIDGIIYRDMITINPCTAMGISDIIPTTTVLQARGCLLHS